MSTGKATSVAWPGAPEWGYTVTGTGATIDAAFTGSKYAGYTSAGETIATPRRHDGRHRRHDLDREPRRDRLHVASGVYADTVTYTVTPNYN